MLTLPFHFSLKKKDVVTIAVGVGPDIGHEELKKIAQNDTSRVFRTNNFQELQNKLADILKASCQGKNSFVILAR